MMRNRFLIGVSFLIVVVVLWGTFHHLGAFPCWIVWGHIMSENNEPIKDATVNVHFGVGADGKASVTGRNGKFVSYVFAPVWSVAKGPPSISVHKAGYREYWGYYRQWPWGLRVSRLNVTLQKGSERPANQ